MFAPPALAFVHLKTNDGGWTFRYFTRDQNGSTQTNCIQNDHRVDPTNIIASAYGAAPRMDSHLAAETHFGHTINPGVSLQSICGLLGDSGSLYSVVGDQFEEQDGHSLLQIFIRAHFRGFKSPQHDIDIGFYDHGSLQTIQGFSENGQASKLRGKHNGQYP